MALHFPAGIRKRIILGFYLLLFFMIGTGLLTYVIVSKVEQKVELVEIINDFLDTTLEVRRFEKNYLLYNDEYDFQENMAFWHKLERLPYENIRLLSASMTQTSFSQLWQTLHDYKEKMQQLHELNGLPAADPRVARDRPRLEEEVRRLGKALTDIAESTSRAERQSIRNLLQTTGKVLIPSMIVLVVLCVVLATKLSRSIFRSLKVLEDHTRKISRGEFVAATISVTDPEINSLLQAFNRMTIELGVRQQQLVQSEKLASLGTLLSGVAHELNNPLSNISTSAQILDEEIEEAEPEFRQGLIQQIMEQADRARDIVKSLLEFSRADDFNKQPLNLKTLFEKTIVLIRGQVPSEVDFRLDIPDTLEIAVDRQRMQQVFLNLIKNATDVVGNEGHIWISAREVAKKGARSREVEILIEDDGPGILPENIQKIFDPFFTTKDVGYGSGLGLYIVHDIVEQHGGEVRVESVPGKGTTFIIWLPNGRGEKK